MAEKNRTALKSYFETGDRPTQDEFVDLIDSKVNRGEDKATLAEALSTNDTKYITPRTANHIVDNAVPNATTTTRGKVELATLAEVTTGTDSVRAVTPAGAKRAAEEHAPVTSVNGQTGAVTVVTGGSDSGWQNATLQNGIENYSVGSYGAARYRKKDGVVHIQGLVRNGTPTGAQTTIFQLPVGYRPDKQLILSTIVSGNVMRRVDISAAGVVSCYSYNTSWTSISGLSFVAV
ncbi:hypothetical protein U8527_07705 [Kordia algicida OT-1]|uniref:Uncharacterized protein n=1 Tax=Kordia algicida OT-1 TaxID=391587 RepID=A9E8P3_9FLAO|nr:hypothetical protein [Kordia algicida]EDP94787.1 hypothetical protein KAOT1_01135 [Kordia algicida OT-1]